MVEGGFPLLHGVCFLSGLMAPEMLCIQPLLSPWSRQPCPCCSWGREGPAAPSPAVPLLCILHLLRDHGGCWAYAAGTRVTLMESALLTEHFWMSGSPSATKAIFLTPKKYACLPKNLQLIELGSQTLFAWVLLVVMGSFWLCDH